MPDANGSGWSLVAPTVFKTGCDLTTSGWVGSIPMHSRQRRHARSRSCCLEMLMSRHLRRSFGWALLCVAPVAARAQRADTTHHTDTTHRAPTKATAAVTARPDSLAAPLTPRRALLYSIFVPGSAQSILGRHKAAAAFVLVEAITISMVRESIADVRQAQRFANDSIVTSYVDPSGNPFAPVPVKPPQFDTSFVKSRRAHTEDWAALLVANHLFSAADAFVAANLWKVQAHLSLRATPDGAVVGASLAW